MSKRPDPAPPPDPDPFADLDPAERALLLGLLLDGVCAVLAALPEPGAEPVPSPVAVDAA